MRLKIIEYNILNGLCSEERPFKTDKKRKDALIKFLEKEKPDILILCEASVWPMAKQDSFGDFAKLISELCDQSGQKEDFRWAPAIFSRFPISAKNLSSYYKSFVRCSIGIGRKSLNVDVVHPNPALSEKEREDFFRRALKGRKDPYIIAGDFNSLHPKDHYDKKMLIEGYKKFMNEGGEAKAEDIMRAKAMGTVMEAGLIDSHLEHNEQDFTVPTDWRNKNKDSAVRLDYIFCSDDIKVIDSGIIKNDFSENASDHYPIFAVLQI